MQRMPVRAGTPMRGCPYKRLMQQPNKIARG